MKKKTKQLCLTLCMLFFTGFAMAQQRTVTGKVIDEGGNPLPNVSYTIKGTQTGGMTDAEGNFSVQVSGNNAVLVFSEVSHKTQEVQVGTQSSLTVVLAAQAGSLQEVVVTALGIQRQKASLGYSVQEVSGGTIADAHETNVTNALSGKVSGLQVVRSSNGAGGSSKLVLRGFNSLQGTNQPLIVVDGIPMENFLGADNNDFWNPGLDYGNGLGDINPDDIASITVLKGQSAAALYGARGGNGVIMITTKSGKRQSGLGLSLTTTHGTENMFLIPDLQSSFGQGSEGIFNAESNLSYGPKIEGQTVTKWDGKQVPLRAYDNLKTFLRNGTSQHYGLSLQQQIGGTAVYSSVNYMDDRSIIPGNKLIRTNISTRAATKFGNNDKWTSDVKISYNNTGGFNRPITGKDRSSVYTLLMMPRSMDVSDFKGALNEFGQMLWYPGSLAWTMNPYWLYQYNLNHDVRDRFLLNGSLKYDINSWLNAEIRGGADMYSMNTDNKTYAGGGTLTNSYSTSKQNFEEKNFSAMLNARKDELFGKIGGALMIGGNIMDQKWSSLGVSTGELEVPNLFSVTNGKGNPSVSGGFSHKKINSIYGSLELNYDRWLYLTFTDRNDWTSTLSKNNRSYSYPSVSISYVLNEMLASMGTMMPDWVNHIKLRGSYASVGNDMGPYNLLNGYNISKDPLGHIQAGKEDTYKDPNVVNELLKSTELGAEMRFLNNRLGLDVTYYKSNATNQLIQLPADPMSGFARRIINAGNIQNKGVELMIDANILQGQALTWNLRANYSSNRNLIVDIAKDSGVTSYRIAGFDNLYINAENGHLFGTIYGTKYRRVTDAQSPFFNELLLDGDGLPVATGESMLLGNQQARSLVGITNSFGFRNFELSFQIDGRFGGQIFSATHAAMQANGTAAVTTPGGVREKFILSGVVANDAGVLQKNTKEVSQQDYWNRIGTAGNVGIGEANIYDATNVRLRNVSLGYTLPKSKLGNTFQRVRVTASCNNVWMITSHMGGIDPESVFAISTNATGFESGAFPTMRTFQFSLNLGF